MWRNVSDWLKYLDKHRERPGWVRLGQGHQTVQLSTRNNKEGTYRLRVMR